MSIFTYGNKKIENNSNNGKLFSVTFDTSALKAGEYDIYIAYRPANVLAATDNDSEVEVPFELVHGKLVVEGEEPQIMYGDVDNNGVVNLKDATLIRRYYVGGWGVDLDITVADVDCNGVVNLKDATLIRRYYVGGWGTVLGPQN
ncbi:MAG: dockerin type I repeat-containing protein [Clostridia bacterium]|nr:dockerin type I repeat-containing protein [Clostridia bacterium]